MNKIITYENLKYFAYSNDKICKKPIKGIAFEFFGLGCQDMFDELKIGKSYAEKGILFLVPYNNPWAWMNKQAVEYTDEILDVLFKEYNLPENTPIVSAGGSMGGQSALVYCKYAKRTPVACVVSCPVCDLPYHYTERNDLPRTLYSSFFNYDCSLDEAMKSASPYHLASSLPKINYHIIHCELDKSVNIEKHSVRFVNELNNLGYNCTFDICPDRDHCDLTEEYRHKYSDFVTNEILNAK